MCAAGAIVKLQVCIMLFVWLFVARRRVCVYGDTEREKFLYERSWYVFGEGADISDYAEKNSGITIVLIAAMALIPRF